MSKPTGKTPRHNPSGHFERTCPECQMSFRTDNYRTRYCSYKCKERFNNHRFYAANSRRIINAVIVNRLHKRKARKCQKTRAK